VARGPAAGLQLSNTSGLAVTWFQNNRHTFGEICV